MGIIKKLLPLIGIILFIYLVSRVGLSVIIETILRADMNYVVIAFFFIIPIVFFQTLKWYAILKRQKIKISLNDALKVHLISMFYGTITPARIGSFIKIAYLQERLKNFGKSASSVVIDRFMDMLSVLILACIGTVLILSNQIPNVTIILFSVFVILSGFFVLLVSKNRGQKIMRFLYEKLLPKGLKGRTRESFNEFYKSLPKRRTLAIPFLLNILTWMIVYTQLYLIGRAIGINLQYLVIIFIFPIATIIAEIPISISGLGVREASLITMLGLFGVRQELVISMSVVGLLISNVFPALIGIFLALKGYKIKSLSSKS